MRVVHRTKCGSVGLVAVLTVICMFVCIMTGAGAVSAVTPKEKDKVVEKSIYMALGDEYRCRIKGTGEWTETALQRVQMATSYNTARNETTLHLHAFATGKAKFVYKVQQENTAVNYVLNVVIAGRLRNIKIGETDLIPEDISSVKYCKSSKTAVVACVQGVDGWMACCNKAGVATVTIGYNNGVKQEILYIVSGTPAENYIEKTIKAGRKIYFPNATKISTTTRCTVEDITEQVGDKIMQMNTVPKMDVKGGKAILADKRGYFKVVVYYATGAVRYRFQIV